MNGSVSRVLWRAAVLLVVSLLVATLWAVTNRFNGTGGGSDLATADPTDLTAAIRPTIEVIERIRLSTGTYPKTRADLVGRMPTGVLMDVTGTALSFDTGGGAVWLYAPRQDGQGFEMTRHLGDGRRIAAVCDHGTITWHTTGGDDSTPSMLPPDG